MVIKGVYYGTGRPTAPGSIKRYYKYCKEHNKKAEYSDLERRWICPSCIQKTRIYLPNKIGKRRRR